MDDNLLVVEKSPSCRCQGFVCSVNQGIDVAALLLSQAFLCPPAREYTKTQFKKKQPRIIFTEYKDEYLVGNYNNNNNNIYKYFLVK